MLQCYIVRTCINTNNCKLSKCIRMASKVIELSAMFDVGTNGCIYDDHHQFKQTIVNADSTRTKHLLFACMSIF